MRLRPYLLAALIVSLPPAAVLGNAIDPSFGVFISGVIVILLWLTATIFIWRETPAERLKRLRSVGISGVACPACGYNMAGLQATTCPECGARFSLDQIVGATLEARQPVEES